MDKTIRILMLEAAESDAELVERELRRGHLAFAAKRVWTKEAFTKELEDFKPDLVLSDYLLPSFDGLSALSLVRGKSSDLPFIFVSWEIHEDSVIETFNKGATDYVFKDQLSRLILSVVRALREAHERAELRKTREHIIEQERLGALGQMASGIAHDFSNALVPVLGYSELLLNYPENMDDKATLKEFLRMINLAAKDAMDTVQRLREFYRRKEQAKDLAPVNLKQIVQDVVSLTQPKWKGEAMAKGAAIEVRMECEELPEIFANDSALRECLTNILLNALDAMPAGGAVTFRGYPDGDGVVLEISDTGVGMTEEVRIRCFEPFFSTKGKTGTGMGLAMVYGIIRRHEGTIDIESELGRGSKFIIRLPRRSAGPVQKTDLPGYADKPVSGPLPRLSVLVVDDEPQVLKVVSDYLRMDGHTAETAGGVDEGLEKFNRGKFDLVITDWAMPGKNGDELIAAIKEKSPQTPVIMLTGFGALVKDREPALNVDLLLSKPLTLAALREALSQVAPKNESSPSKSTSKSRP